MVGRCSAAGKDPVDPAGPTDHDLHGPRGRLVGVLGGGVLPLKGVGVKDAPQGGVGLPGKQGIPARAVSPPRKNGEDPLHTELWESCRWMHVLVGTGTGDIAVHVQPVYGHSGRPADDAAFFGRVLEYAALVGNAPQIVAGNINDPLDTGGLR